MITVQNLFEKAVVAVSIFLLGAIAHPIGIIVPREPTSTPPILTSIDVKTDIVENIARSRLTQVFSNPNPRPVEADFYFPVSREADITDFVLYMDGKPVRGEVLDKAAAHQTYRDIVRRMKDPGLIEWADKNLFRVRVFPIPANGEQKLEIELTQSLAADQGFFEYRLPLELGANSSGRQLPRFSFGGSIKGKNQISNVFSPSHELKTTVRPDGLVEVHVDQTKQADIKSLVLYYQAGEGEMSLGLLAHREKDQSGYFTVRISPPWEERTTVSQPADYLFVIDSSGSMTADGKMEQAKKALLYCIRSLSPDDRFNLIRFSSSVDEFRSALESANESSKAAAESWINELAARGGTNISGALDRALNLVEDSKTSEAARLLSIVFLTDGLPTVGETSADKIIKQVESGTGANVRIFTFGLGNDVNTRLLDSIADGSGAASDYIAPETDLEVPISRFFDKISRPALVDPRLEISGVELKELYPADLPDLFYGTDMAVFGQYDKSGTATVTLKGTLGGEAKRFTYEKVFPEEEADNDFVEKLWATRKIAWLLDQVRRAGESEELKTEITKLARKYDVVTPYTSYLALEDKSDQQYVDNALPAPGQSGGIPRAHAAPASARPENRMRFFASDAALKAESGAAAVETARQLRTMKTAETVRPAVRQSELKHVQGRTFTLVDSVWTDSTIKGPEEVVKVKTFSEAWFKLADASLEIRAFLELGDRVRFKLSNTLVVETGPQGIDSVEDILLRLPDDLLPRKK